MPKRLFLRIAAATAMLASLAFAGQASFGGSPTYVVRAGDSLWSIARSHGTTMEQLASLNGMQLSEILQIGRHLLLPGPSGTAGASPATGVSQAAVARAATVPAGPVPRAHFCASFTPSLAPRGSLPPLLAASPARLALRPLFERWGGYYGVPPALLEAIAWQESGWQQNVVSSAGAIGIGQVLPSTARFVSQDLAGIPLDVVSASDNVRIEARYVSFLSEEENYNTCRMIAAYDEGPGNLSRYGVLPSVRQYVADVEYLVPAFD